MPYLPPATKPPTPGADYHIQVCFAPGTYTAQSLVMGFGWVGTAVWNGRAPQPPPLVDQAMEAQGQIVLPNATLALNPTDRTFVNLDTWFWAQGLTGEDLKGTSAFGLVAIATPSRLVVTPGDGSAPLTCPWVTKKSDRCAYPYRRSSTGGPLVAASGAPAYEASAKAIWTLRFENNGAPVPIPGAPPTLSSSAMTVPVVVDEVQTIVTGTG